MEKEICNNCMPLYSLASLIGMAVVSYLGYTTYNFIDKNIAHQMRSPESTNLIQSPESIQSPDSAIFTIKKKAIEMTLNTYCRFRWTQDQLYNWTQKQIKPKSVPPKFLISRIWKIEGGTLVPIIPRIDPTKAKEFDIISLETLGLEASGSHFNYLIEYYWQLANSDKNKFLLPCPGRRLLSGLDTQADWLFDETTPDEFIEFKLNLRSEAELENFTEMLVQYAGPLQNFYQGSDFEVTGRKIYSTLSGNRILSYTDSIEVTDPILEEKIVFKL